MVDEWKWEETPCRTFRLHHKQLHTGNFVKECWGIQDEQKRGACVMDVQDKYVDRASLEVTMQNWHLVNKAY